jgi:hypothetical protein
MRLRTTLRRLLTIAVACSAMVITLLATGLVQAPDGARSGDERIEAQSPAYSLYIPEANRGTPDPPRLAEPCLPTRLPPPSLRPLIPLPTARHTLPGPQVLLLRLLI